MNGAQLISVDDVTDRLGELLESRPAAEDALFEAMKTVTLEHARSLQELGPVRALALDPCPRCGGNVIASETDARCASGCDWSYRRLGA